MKANWKTKERGSRAAPQRAAVACALAFLCPPTVTYAEPSLPPVAGLPVEAPSSVFSAGSGKGELLAAGSWQLSLLSSIEILRPAGGGLQLGQVQPILLTQVPDLLLSFNYDDRWYVEARVSPDAASTRYAAGYKGGPAETLEELRIGNSLIGLPDLPFLPLGDGGAYSFGALLKARGGGLETQAMLRYDQADRVRRFFTGSMEISEQTRKAGEFVRGRWFLIGAVTGLKIWARSDSGQSVADDGTKWRRLGIDEYSLSEGGTVLSLDAVSTTGIALAWDGIAAPDISIDGMGARVAFDPKDKPSNLELLSRYSMSPTSGEAFVRDRASGKRDSRFVVQSMDNGLVEVRFAPGTSPMARPFEGDVPTLYSHVPDSDIISFPDLDEFEIVSQSFASNDGISIEAGVIAASIEVLRDGVPDPAFEIDRVAGRLVLLNPPKPSERIEVSYLRESAERRAGALSAGLVGIWKGDGIGAWAALAGHLGLAGQGFAEGGQTSPAWAELAAGSSKSEGKLTWKLGISGRLGYAESSGRYRLESMEGQGKLSSSYWPSGGSTPLGFSYSQTADPAFDEAWPTLNEVLHPDGAASEGLAIQASASSSGPLSLERIIDAPPLSSFGSLVFFAKCSALSAGTLTVLLDDGQSGNKAFEVLIPLSELTDIWTRVKLDFSSGKVTMRIGEGGVERASLGAWGERHAQVRSASRLVITLDGIASPASIWVDEILLEDPTSSASLGGSAVLRYRDPEFALGPAKNPVLGGLDADLTSSGELSGESWTRSQLDAKTEIGPFSVDLGLDGTYDAAGVSMSGSHSLSFEPQWSFLKAKDQFAPAPGGAGYSKADGASISLFSLVTGSADFSSRFAANPQASEDGLLRRTWKFALGTGGLVSAKVEAEEDSDLAPASVRSNYYEKWVASFGDYSPEPRGLATKRRMSGTVDFLSFSNSPLFSSSLSLRSSLIGNPLRGERLGLRLGKPIALPGSVRIFPWYSRTWRDTRATGEADLLAFLGAGTKDLSSVTLPWMMIPFAEFVDDRSKADFALLAIGTNLADSDYTPEIGFRMERDPGSSPLDLLIPSLASVSVSRELSSDGFALRDTKKIASSLVFSALELFGSEGAHPVFTRYANDEYRLGLNSAIELPSGQSLVNWSVSEEGLVSLLGNRGNAGNQLAANERFELQRLPSGLTYFVKAGFDLSSSLERSWLLSLFDLIAGGTGAGLGGLPKGKGLESTWLRSLSSTRPAARQTASLDASVKGTVGDVNASPSVRLSEALESRVSTPERLEAWSRLKLLQDMDSAGNIVLGFEASLGLTLSF